MKRMISSCKQFLLMVVKEKKPEKTNVVESYNAKQQANIEKLFQSMISCLKVYHPKRK